MRYINAIFAKLKRKLKCKLRAFRTLSGTRTREYLALGKRKSRFNCASFPLIFRSSAFFAQNKCKISANLMRRTFFFAVWKCTVDERWTQLKRKENVLRISLHLFYTYFAERKRLSGKEAQWKRDLRFPSAKYSRVRVPESVRKARSLHFNLRFNIANIAFI